MDKPINHHLNATMTARTDYAFSTKTQDGYLTPNLECLIGHGAVAFGSVTPHHASQDNEVRKTKIYRTVFNFYAVIYISCSAWNTRMKLKGNGYQYFIVEVL